MTDTSPSPVSNWHWPTPHEVLTFLFVCACAVRESGLFADGSWMIKVCVAVYIGCAMAGVSAARQYLSPRIRSILNEHDECQHPTPEELKR